VSSSTDINANKLAEFFVEKVEGVRAAAVAVVCLPWRSAALQLPWSFYWGSATSDNAFACLVKSSALDPLPTFIQRELVDVTATVRDTSSSRSCWWHLTAWTVSSLCMYAHQ